MRLARSFLLLSCICALTLPLFARDTPLKGTPAARLIEVAKKEKSVRVIVGVRDDAWQPEGKLRAHDVAVQRNRGKAKVDAVIRAHPKMRAVPGWQFVTLPGFVAEVNEAALRQLLDDERIESVEEDVEGEFTLGVSVGAIGANAVHDGQPVGYRGSGQIVVVIDGGVDHGHPFFGSPSRVLSDEGACFSGDKVSGINDLTGTYTSVCPNGTQREVAPGAGAPCTFGDMTDPRNPCNHGTRVAGVVAGSRTGVTGVAPAANIIPIQVASKKCGPTICDTSVLKSSVINALDDVASRLWAAHGRSIAAVNLSVGFGLWPSRAGCDSGVQMFRNAVANVVSKDIPVVAATGNNESRTHMTAPACFADVIAVSAVTDSYAVPDYANVADFMDLFAPGGASGSGNGIETSLNRGCPTCALYGDDYGTSMAAPHVAGAIALLREKTPLASIADIRSALIASPYPVTDSRDGGNVTKPRLRVDHAMNQMQPLGPPTGFVATGTSLSTVHLSWIAPPSMPAGTKYLIRFQTQKDGSWTIAKDDLAVTETSFDHAAPAAGTLYRYEIVTKNGSALSAGAYDYAVTRPFTAIPASGTQPYIAGIYVGELQQAADAWRKFAINTEPDSSYPAATGVILASYFTEIVDALNEALPVLGRPTFAYAGVLPPASGVIIDRRHVEQLQEAMK